MKLGSSTDWRILVYRTYLGVFGNVKPYKQFRSILCGILVLLHAAFARIRAISRTEDRFSDYRRNAGSPYCQQRCSGQHPQSSADQLRSLLDQTLPIKVGEVPSAVKVDQKQSWLLIRSPKLQRKMASRGDDIIAFDQMAGLVFALGGRSLGHPVFPCCAGNGSLYCKLALQFAEEKRLKHSLLFLDTAPESDSDVAHILASRGIRYPQDYELIATVAGLGLNFRLFMPLQISKNRLG